MNREMLNRMTKKELIELVERQERAIDRLDMQRYDSNVIIDHLASAIENLNLLRYHDLDRDHDQEYLNDYICNLHANYPVFLVKTETGDFIPQMEEGKEE